MMIPSIRSFGLLASLATIAFAGPVAVRSSDIEVLPTIQERTPSITLGSWDLTTTAENDVLFNLGVGATAANVGDAVHLEVVCVDCRTWGKAVVSTGGVAKNNDLIGDMIEFFENPVDAILSAFDLDLKIEFEEVGGHYAFDILAADTVSYSIPIFTSNTLGGIAISEEVSLGLVVAVDLVFSLTAEIDVEAGFEFSFPEGAYITVDPLTGDIVDQSFLGGSVDNLPITVTSGSATFKAALRVRIQTGTTVVLFGTGFDFELGVFADLIEYVATIGFSDECELYITESVDVNIGAFARAVVEINYHSFGVSPTVVTTLLDIPLPSLCLTRPVASATLPYATSATATVVGSTAAYSLGYSPAPYPTASYPGYPSGVPYPTGHYPAHPVDPYPTASYSDGYPVDPYPTDAYPTGAYPTDAYPTESYPVESYSVSGYVSVSYSASASESTSKPVGTVSVSSSSSHTSYSHYTLSFPASGYSSAPGPISTPPYPTTTSTALSSGTLTSAPSLTTSTVYTTSLYTITSCGATVLHCPASSQSEIVITSTKILYTTVCPVGQSQPTIAPSASTSKSAGVHTSIATVLPIPLIPHSTPIVSTVYTTSFVTPTYAVPTATSFSVPFPNYTTIFATTSIVVVTSAPSSVSTSAPVSTLVYSTPVHVVGNGTAYPIGTGYPSGTIGTLKPYPTGPAKPSGPVFTSAAGRSAGVASGALATLLVAFFVLL